MRLNVQTNFPSIQQQLDVLGRQAPFVVAVSLTRTAKDVQTAIKGEMRRAFDRPTAYTLNGMFLKPASKTNLEARVWLKDDAFGPGTQADRYLGPQITGGVRGQKGMERLLQATGLMATGQFAVPGPGARMDSNGNVARSQIIQIMSQLKVQERAGYESRANSGTRSRRTVTRQGVTYFALKTVTRGLQPGIYIKRKTRRGTTIKPVFLFVSKVLYRPRLKFFEVGNATALERFPVHFNTEMRKAIANARLN